MKRPWMPLWVADYLSHTQHLRAAQSGAYLHLIMHYWQTGGLPTDDNQLAAIARMSSAEWKKSKPVIQAFFKQGWRHERVEKELVAAVEKYEKRAAAGQKGGIAVPEHKQPTSNAHAMQNQSQPHSPTHQESKNPLRRVGEVKRKGWSPPKHGATGRGFTYILKDREEWQPYCEDYQSVHGCEPTPDAHGGKWFKTAGEASAA